MNRYQDIPVVKTSTGIHYYKNNKYPRIPLSTTDIYVITTDGDRFDTLSAQYYTDPSLWWIISLANEHLPQNSLFIPLGTQIRIPINVAQFVAEYNILNQT
jgi:hypothetical protein